MLNLTLTKRTDARLLARMSAHYSQPKGFVGRTLAYAIEFDDVYYGHILAGSATLHLPNRNSFFNVSKNSLNQIINNSFFNVSPVGKKYPCRNFVTQILTRFVKQAQIDWLKKYNDIVVGFETLVEPPRTGESYLRAGWTLLGQTRGFTCKRIAGKGGEPYDGIRVWNTDTLRPKLVFGLKVQ